MIAVAAVNGVRYTNSVPLMCHRSPEPEKHGRLCQNPASGARSDRFVPGIRNSFRSPTCYHAGLSPGRITSTLSSPHLTWSGATPDLSCSAGDASLAWACWASGAAAATYSTAMQSPSNTHGTTAAFMRSASPGPPVKAEMQAVLS